MSSKQRTPEEIRASIEAHRNDLTQAVGDLTVATQQATDWRRQVRRKPMPFTGAAVAAGFLLGGGLAALAAAIAG
jgi:dienelactone hydrolase